MHFITLISVDIPTVEKNPEENTRIQEIIMELEKEQETNPKGFMTKFNLARFRGLSSEFARAVYNAVDAKMEPYCFDTEDPEYVEFCDETEELQHQYKTRTCDCIRLPDGRIAELGDSVLRYRFDIRGNKVYQKKYGMLKKEKRSHKAKKMKAMPNYPVKKLYKTFKEYADTRSTFFATEQAYGYFYNPDGFYDWYVIGGRWPDVFLVKEDCEEYSIGEISAEMCDLQAPMGYRWVVAARKKDIQWAEMRQLELLEIGQMYDKLRQAFEVGKLPAEWHAQITSEGIFRGNRELYIAGEEREQFISRLGYADENMYTRLFAGFLSDSGFEEDQELLREYIENLDENAVLVAVDCHE